jgi:putative transposase
MPRRPRSQLANVPQLISLQGHNNDPVFVQPEDYSTFLSCVEESGHRNNCELHAYSLLPNRVVLLATPIDDGNLSIFLQGISRRYVPFFNAKRGRCGALWNGRFRAAIVEPTGCVVTAYQFVDTLAVRSETVTSPGDHPYSSFSTNISGRRHTQLREHRMWSHLMAGTEADRHEYRRICEMGLNADRTAEVERAIHHGLVFGCEQYKNHLHVNHGIKVRLGQPGRPAKQKQKLHRVSEATQIVLA